MQQLERVALREAALARLRLVVYLCEALWNKTSSVFPPDRARGKTLTTTSDFLTPNTASLSSHSSPSGYHALVSFLKPGASTMMCKWFGRMLCLPVARSS